MSHTGHLGFHRAVEEDLPPSAVLRYNGVYEDTERMQNMDYDELVRFWCVANPGESTKYKAYMKREFMENIQDPRPSADIECLRCIEAGDLQRLKCRNEAGFTWQAYKFLMMELCIVYKRWDILQYLIVSKQINRDIGEAIDRLTTDDSWKCLPRRELVDATTLHGLYHNLTCIDV